MADTFTRNKLYWRDHIEDVADGVNDHGEGTP
jgi:hypothetical protein